MRLPRHAIFALSHLTLDRCPFGVIRTFIVSSINLYKHRCHVSFLKSCRALQLLPRFICDIKLPTTINLRCDRRIRGQILRSCIKSHYTAITKEKTARHQSTLILKSSLSENVISYIMHVADMAMKIENETIVRRQKRKLLNLSLKNENENTATHMGLSEQHSINSMESLRCCPTTPKISVIGEVNLSNAQRKILELGPKFIPSHGLNDKKAEELRISLAHIAYQLRWKEHATNTQVSDGPDSGNPSTSPPFPRFCPFEGKRFPPPKATTIVERIQSLVDAVDRLILREQRHPTHKHNLSLSDRQLLKNMRNDNYHYIPSDKGGEMVILTSTQYNSLSLAHLSDETTYRRITKDPTHSQELEINTLWKNASLKTTLPISLVKKLTTRHSRIAQFYHLPKTHKRELAIRPIVSAINSPCEKMAWLLQQIFQPLLADVPAHLESTHELLSRLKSIPSEHLNGKTMISLDVVSLYTNVDIQEALIIMKNLFLFKYGQSIWGIPMVKIMDILTYILTHNSFHFNGSFFNQVRGLGMGSRISPTVAILVMDHLERSTLFQRTLNQPVTFLRYIDDCVLPIDRNVDCDNLLQELNLLHPSIKFELQQPNQDGFLPVLDTTVRVLENGQLQHKFYVKEANRNLFLHAKSALPDSVKRNAVKEELQRAKSLCSEDSTRRDAEQRMLMKFQANGYNCQQINRYTKNSRRRQQQRRDHSCIFKVPFISDQFNGQLKRLLKKSSLDIRLVTQPAPSISRQLNKNKRYQNCNLRSCPIQNPAICNATNVVYRATCSVCGQFYIGSTSPPFHKRVAQHCQPSRRTAVHNHATSHQQSTKAIFDFSIVSRHENEIRCRIAEALTITKLSPTLNAKDEYLDYRPFLT